MRPVRFFAFAIALLIAVPSMAFADSSGRIYGRLTTVDGDAFEGLIRWDKNEGSWVDVLNGNKELPRASRKRQRRKYSDRQRTVKIFGLRILQISISKDNTCGTGLARSGIRFGHIRTLEVIDDNTVLLTLKSDETVEVENYSTDIGESIRELIIEDRQEGEIELDWDDLERIDFMQCDSDIGSNFGKRLYGILTTRRGDEYTGWVCWDVDELFTRDILDGEHKRRRRKLKFGQIRSIERYSSKGATVTLNNGDELLLRGTNDVDDSNRGIAISDAGLGQVVIDWDDFDRLDFKSPPAPIEYDEFDGGHPLEGTVYTEDGEQYTGHIRWDDDEQYTWEILDGDYRDVEFDIEFGLIREIERNDYRSSIVTLRDGRSFKLRGSNDVDEDNKGIFIELDDGDEIEVEWDEFDKVEFVQK